MQDQPIDIAKLNAQLAENNQRNSIYINALAARIDNLVDAAKEEDWGEVRRMAEYLARSGSQFGCPTVTESAGELCSAMDNLEDKTGIRRNIVRLIGTCGRV